MKSIKELIQSYFQQKQNYKIYQETCPVIINLLDKTNFDEISRFIQEKRSKGIEILLNSEIINEIFNHQHINEIKIYMVNQMAQSGFKFEKPFTYQDKSGKAQYNNFIDYLIDTRKYAIPLDTVTAFGFTETLTELNKHLTHAEFKILFSKVDKANVFLGGVPLIPLFMENKIQEHLVYFEQQELTKCITVQKIAKNKTL